VDARLIDLAGRDPADFLLAILLTDDTLRRPPARVMGSAARARGHRPSAA